MKKKVILAYSGGLDTTTIIPWLIENYDYEVICCCVNVGQSEELDGLEERAKKSGAKKLYIIDAVDEYVNNNILPTLQAGAVFENKYLLGTATARPIITKKLVEVAKEENASAICHGATGKGNDQIRFELGIKALAPELEIIAPWRIWDITSREESIEYCIKHGIDLPFNPETSYSRDRNIWHISHEGLELEDPSLIPNYDNLLVMSVSPQNAPDLGTNIEIEWENGFPIKLNKNKLSTTEILEQLNIVGGKNGIGIIDIVENRVVGMKSRGIYETPGGTILLEAHKQLEELILDKETLKFKQIVGIELAELIYGGKWFSPLREALSAFVTETQKNVSGITKLKLYKGNIIKQGTTSPFSLYDADIASFKTGDLYDHKDAQGFITLYGLSTKVRALKLKDSKN